MSILRSQKMKYCHLICNEDSAWENLNELGEISAIHFVDSDPRLPLINRPFANYVKRCDQVNLNLEFIKENITKFNEKITPCDDFSDLIQTFKQNLEKRSQNEGKRDGKTYFHEIESEVTEQHRWLEEQLRQFENLTQKLNELKEYKAVLVNGQKIIGNNFFSSNQDQGNVDISGMNLEQVLDQNVSMNQIVGLIDSTEALRFSRMVFRVTKGNAYTEIADVDWKDDYVIDPITLKPVDKKVFIIVYPGGTMDIIKNKLNRICDSFSCSRFGFPPSQEQFLQKINEIENNKREASALVDMTQHGLQEFLKGWANCRVGCKCSKIEEYSLYSIKEKGLYNALNMLKTDQKIYQGYAWIPKVDLDLANKKLQDLSIRNPDIVGGQIRPQKKPKGESNKPPTAFKLNEFTAVFQLLTNTYGTPRYKEINPSLFNLITFPFLFGVMFGDIAHGGLLFLFGLFLVLANKSLKGTAFQAFSGARFFILMMGFFALYCGFLYNDFLSLSLDLFGTCYDGKKSINCPYLDDGKFDPKFQCYPYKATSVKPDQPYVLSDCVYPFGIDPIWSIADNQISYMNTFKMKLSVIFGVLQMSFGIILKGWNALSSKQPLDFIFEFIPQIIFLSLTFGYMDFMIIYKWFCNFQFLNTGEAPGIITVLINMPLQLGKPGDHQLYGNPDGSTQAAVQKAFLFTVLIMIPLMLIPKPVLLLMGSKKSHNAPQRKSSRDQPLLQNNNDLSFDDHGIQGTSHDNGLEQELEASLIEKSEQHAGDHEEHSAGELVVHQVIETIEFVLGSISNTASYLRLWALSLAHSQLADVFFKNGIEPFISAGGVGGGFSLVIGYFVFAIITFGVLMCMDVLECFLHALRLHWVEFQSKFYKADGIEFQPFSFVSIMESSKEAD